MKVLMLILLFSSSVDLSQQQEIRSAVLTAMDQPVTLERILKRYAGSKDQLVSSYVGLCLCMTADRPFNPMDKLSRFKKGKGRIEAAISSLPTQIEPRWHRLMVQLEAPGFLHYDGNIEQDFNFLCAKMQASDLSIDQKHAMIDRLLSISLSNAKKSTLKNLKSKIS